MWQLIETHSADGFTIKTYTAPETDAPEDHFTIEGEAQMGLSESLPSIVEDINSGKLAWFRVKVEVSRHGVVLAEEYLGGCCYSSELDFIDIDGYWTDMCEEALSEARRTIEHLECPEV